MSDLRVSSTFNSIPRPPRWRFRSPSAGLVSHPGRVRALGLEPRRPGDPVQILNLTQNTLPNTVVGRRPKLVHQLLSAEGDLLRPKPLDHVPKPDGPVRGHPPDILLVNRPVDQGRGVDDFPQLVQLWRPSPSSCNRYKPPRSCCSPRVLDVRRPNHRISLSHETRLGEKDLQ